MDERIQILVVDDEYLTRLMVRRVLEEQGYSVLEASNGQECLDTCQQHQVKLILMDVRMPVLNGFETCRRLRASMRTAYTPVLMLTSLDDPVSVSTAFDAGATDFVTKPINWGLLAQRIRYALRTNQTELALRKQQDVLERAQQLAQMGTWIYTPKTRRIKITAQLAQILLLTADHSYSVRSILHLVHKDDRPALLQYLRGLNGPNHQADLEIRFSCSTNNSRFLAISASLSQEDEPNVNVLGMAQDVTARRVALAKLNYQANFDALTGLPNRAMFMARLDTAIQRASGEATSMAVFQIGLDVLQKSQAGLTGPERDNLWKQVAHLLEDLVREYGLLARIETNTFTLLIDALQSTAQATDLARKISSLFAYPINLGHKELLISSACGIAVYPLDGRENNSLLMHASAAMTSAMQNPSPQYQFHTPDLQKQVQDLHNTEVALFHALSHEEFELHYQPKVDLRTRCTTGVEALLRWSRPSMGLQSPDTFIPILEQTGLILPVGVWVIQKACQDLHRTGLEVAVNLSPRQFQQPLFVDQVAQTLSAFNMPARLLELEITEQTIAEDGLAMKHLTALKSIGLSTGLDDYGTGFSSLNRLKQLPLTTLKIDRAFVRNLLTDRFDSAIVSSTIALAHELGLHVVAEGVEDEPTLAMLTSMGCDSAQGFYMARPMPLAKLMEWLATSPFGLPRGSSP
jgi:diguanylate cyclase (GGDEF)-like protein